MQRRCNVRREDPRRFNAENRPDPFSASEHAIAHGFMKRRRLRVLARQQLPKRGVHELQVFFKKRWKLHRGKFIPICRQSSRAASGVTLRPRLPPQKAAPPACRPISSAESLPYLQPLPVASDTRATTRLLLQKVSSPRPTKVADFQVSAQLLQAAQASARNLVFSAVPAFSEQVCSRGLCFARRSSLEAAASNQHSKARPRTEQLLCAPQNTRSRFQRQRMPSHGSLRSVSEGGSHGFSFIPIAELV